MVKKVFVIIILYLIILSNGFSVYGVNFDPDAWDPSASVSSSTIPQSLQDKVGPILAFIQAIGTVVSVIALMIIGFRTLTGSLEEKSAYKESLPGYVIGIFLLFSMTTIPNIIYNFMK